MNHLGQRNVRHRCFTTGDLLFFFFFLPSPRLTHSLLSLLPLHTASTKWAIAERNLSIGQIFVGLIILLLSTKYLYQFTETTGLFLGALLIASGVFGYLGSTRRSANLVNLQLVLSIVGILLAFQFVGEVVRDAQVDCALAELHQRGRATDRALDATRDAEAMHAVYDRLNELEDTLTLVQQGAGTSADLKKEQQQLRFTDLNYIRAKVDMVRRHAEDVLASVLKNDSINAATISQMSEEEKAGLRRRLDTADRVMDRIQRAHGNGEEAADVLAFDEYREILAALTDIGVVPDKAAHPELIQAMRELPNMQAAMQRQRADSYQSLMVGSAGAEMQRQQETRRVKREKFEATFKAQLDNRQAGGKDYVADLPEHCVKETAGEKVVVVSGVMIIVLQLASAYISLSLSFRLPQKAE